MDYILLKSLDIERKELEEEEKQLLDIAYLEDISNLKAIYSM